MHPKQPPFMSSALKSTISALPPNAAFMRDTIWPRFVCSSQRSVTITIRRFPACAGRTSVAERYAAVGGEIGAYALTVGCFAVIAANVCSANRKKFWRSASIVKSFIFAEYPAR